MCLLELCDSRKLHNFPSLIFERVYISCPHLLSTFDRFVRGLIFLINHTQARLTTNLSDHIASQLQFRRISSVNSFHTPRYQTYKSRFSNDKSKHPIWGGCEANERPQSETESLDLTCSVRSYQVFNSNLRPSYTTKLHNVMPQEILITVLPPILLLHKTDRSRLPTDYLLAIGAARN